MIKKNVTYKNFEDIEITETLHFHFTEAELVELESSEEGGLTAWGETLKESGNIEEILAALKKIIGKAYGEKMDGGRRFVKNDLIVDSFKSSEAYSTLLFQLLENPTEAGEFFKALVPKNSSRTPSKLTPAEQARANSEAQMRGFRKPAEKSFTPDTVPEIVETQSADTTSATQFAEQAPTPDVIPATAPGEETAEQKRARLLAELAELG